jgi:hypothetical protein
MCFAPLKLFNKANPLSVKVAKVLLKDRKELKNMVLTLRTLRLLSVLCG